MIATPLATPVKLNLGCGRDVREGYVNVDKFPTSAEIIKAEFPTLPFESDFADEVLLNHVLEHFGYTEALTLVREIHRVLKPFGLAKIEVPDMAWCCAQFLGSPEPACYTDPSMDYSTSHKWGLWAQAIWGDQHNEGLFHKWGYTAHRLLHTLQHAGFAAVKVDFVASHGVQCLSAVAQKGASCDPTESCSPGTGMPGAK